MIRDSVCVVTGAGSGIGFAVAKALVEKGARHVAMVDQRPAVSESLIRLKEQVNGPCSVQNFVADVRSPEARRHVFNSLEQTSGLVTVLVPAAGITRDRLAVKFDRKKGVPNIYPECDWDDVINTNLKAPAYWAMEMAGRIAKVRHDLGKKQWDTEAEAIEGVVCLIGSVSGKGNRGQISYSASKAGLEAIRETLDAELMYHGIHIKLVHPGYTDTEMVNKLDPKVLDQVLQNVRQRRLIPPEEIAETICFLIDTPSVGEITADAGFKHSV